METKLSQLLKLMATEQWESAIKIAAKFPRLGGHKEPITRAASALLAPAFYASMGRDVPAILEAGKQALIARYSAKTS